MVLEWALRLGGPHKVVYPSSLYGSDCTYYYLLLSVYYFHLSATPTLVAKHGLPLVDYHRVCSDSFTHSITVRSFRISVGNSPAIATVCFLLIFPRRSRLVFASYPCPLLCRDNGKTKAA